MSATDTTHTLRMRLMEERPTAVKVTAARRPAVPGQPVVFHWIPRSLIGYARKLAPAVPGDYPDYTFTLPEWKIEQANLWDFVQ